MIGETILQIGLYITTVINIVLSLVIFSRGLFNIRNFVFGMFTLSAAAWTGSIIGFYYFPGTDTWVSWVTLTHVFALMTAVFFLYFTFFFPQNLIRGRYFILLPPAAILLLFTYLLFTSDSVVGHITGIQYVIGPAYAWFALSLMASFFAGYFFLLQQYKRARNPIQRIQTLYVATSGIVSPTLAIIPDLVLPYFGIYSYTWMGPPFTLIMVVALFIAMVRFHLFNIKVITTEIFSSLIVIVLLAQLFLATSATGVIITTFILIMVAVFSYLLIQSVYREVEIREEVQRLARELADKNEKLTELDKMKSQFLSIASHDLRTPITAIRNFMSLVLDGTYGKMPVAAEEGLRQIFDRATQMTSLVETYLNVSRIEQGNMKYDFVDSDFTKVVKDAANFYADGASKKGLKLSLTIAPGAEKLMAKLDVAKINEVVNNLIDNSIKYTPSGTIQLTLEKVVKKARFTLQDTGVGMTPKTIGGLFKLFSPGEDSKKINPSSNGIGLYITKAHVEAHKGTIKAESEGQGKGSRFVVEIPLISGV